MKNKKRSGQSLVEYALILALVSTVCFFALSNLGQQVKHMLNRVAVELQQVNQMTQQQQVIDPIENPVDPPTPCNNGNGHGHGYGRCR